MAESGGSSGSSQSPERPSSLADRNGALKCTFSAAGHSTGLLQGLAALRAQGQLLDVVLTVNSEAFHAHKVVLAACSDYFRCCRWWSCARTS
uniref:Kelch-like 26 n=1 Tax=Mus musculus TaxID=10090 RepID=A0A1B0GR96_MOUSE